MDGAITVGGGGRTEPSSSRVHEIQEQCLLFEEGFCSRNAFFSTQSEVIPVAQKLFASKNHKEAERRRRERINSRLDYVRNILPCTSKIDKASLLGKAVEQLNELKQKTSELRKMELTPSDNDEVLVISADFSGDGRSVFKASVCCDDRSDLITDVIEKLRSLRMRILRLEIATCSRRIRHVFVLVEEGEGEAKVSVELLEKTLLSILECPDSGSHRSKRRI